MRNKTGTPSTSQTAYYLSIWSGFGIGLILAAFLARVLPTFGGDVAHARELGVVSQTILQGHSQSRDLVTYLLCLALPAVGALLCWRRFSCHSITGKKHEYPADSAPAVSGRAALILLAVLCFLALDINHFMRPSAGWRLQAEEGQHLAWIDRICRGEVYGRDFLCLYGPMFIYPAAWVAKLTTPSILTVRIITYAMNMAAYGIVLVLLRYVAGKTRRFVAFAVAFYLLNSPFLYLSLQGTHLRPALGFLPIIFCYLYIRSRRQRWLTGLGVAAALSVSFSQEVGVTAGAGCAAMLLVSHFLDRERKVLSWRVVGIAAAAFTVPLLPLLVYFAYHGAIGDVIGNIYEYPRYVMLGFGSLPFPSLLETPFDGTTMYAYATISVYAMTVVTCIIRYRTRHDDVRWILKVGILVFGVLLFRTALGRSDAPHIHFAAMPAMVLLLLLVDEQLDRLRSTDRTIRAGSRVVLAALAIAGAVLVTRCRHLSSRVQSAVVESVQVRRKLSAEPMGVWIPELERAQVYFYESSIADLSVIYAFLEEHTQPGDPTIFFPNGALYNFLFDRPNPTRFVISYFAITTALQEEYVADLEAQRPRYVILDLGAWRPDSIGEAVQIPVILKYINKHYAAVDTAGNIAFLERHEASDAIK